MNDRDIAAGGAVSARRSRRAFDKTVRAAYHLPWTYWAILALVVTIAARNLISVVADLPRLTEAGYGDSYIWYDVQHYLRTGTIYRSPTEPPYNPSIYSPLLYIVLSLPARWTAFANPFLGPRLVVCLFLVFCILLTLSITRRLVRCSLALKWSVLLIVSISVLGAWILQLRADFMGISCSLLCIRLLLSRWRGRFAAAGMAAGMAFLFKLTFVASMVAGVVWLLCRRRFRWCAEFIVCAAAIGAGGYFCFGLAEPRMFEQWRLLAGVRLDYRGYYTIIYQFLSEPVAILSATALPVVLISRVRRWQLPILFAGASLGIGLVTSIQAGGNVNYFFECLFALTPLAAFAVLRVYRQAELGTAVNVFCGLLILIVLVPPNLRAVYWEAARTRPQDIQSANRRVVAVRHALQDSRVFALVPWVALLTKEPPLTEPFIFSSLSMAGKLDSRPLSESIRRTQFDAIVTYNHPEAFRGVELFSPEFRQAAQAAYTPFCVYGDLLFQLPREKSHPGLVGVRLLDIGCKPVDSGKQALQ